MIKVLFVCLGNICRSPMADAVFRHQVKEAGLSDQFIVDSAGTGDWHVGERPHIGTRKVLEKHKIVYNGRARQLSKRDLTQFDYILAMDAANLATIKKHLDSESHGEIALFLSYAHQAGAVDQETVPDPYYDDRFDMVYDLVDKGCQALLAHIQAEHHLS